MNYLYLFLKLHFIIKKVADDTTLQLEHIIDNLYNTDCMLK